MNRPLLLLLLVPALVLPRSAGQPTGKSKDAGPRALYAIQLAADPGKTTKLTVRGVGVDAATAVRLGEPKSTGRVLGAGRKTPPPNPMAASFLGDSEVDVEVTLPAEVPGGVVPLSLVGPGGEGRPTMVLVNDDTPRAPEKEPNDGFKQAMPVSAPVVIAAVFNQPQDVDVYRIDGKAGDRLRIEAQAGRAGSPADLLLTLYDAAGRIVATGDVPAGGRDPVLRVTVPKDGDYFISAQEAFDQGGPTFVYRLVTRREP